MKAQFNKDKKTIRETQVIAGDYSTMIDARKQHLPGIEDNINEILEDYDGEMIAVIRIREDENGTPQGAQTFISGVAQTESQLQLVKSLREMSVSMTKQLLDGARDEPRLLKEVLTGITKLMGDK